MNLLLILMAADNAAPKSGGIGTGNIITTTLMFVAMCAMIVFVLRNRRAPSSDRPRETHHEEEEQDIYDRVTPSVIDKSIEEALNRVHRLDSDMNARIDTRLRVLQQLLREADLKIEELKRLQYLSTFPGAGDQKPAPTPSQPAPVVEKANSTPAVSAESSKSDAPESDGNEREKLKERYAEIYRLKDENTSEYDIARQTNLTISEIRFILSLRNQ